MIRLFTLRLVGVLWLTLLGLPIISLAQPAWQWARQGGGSGYDNGRGVATDAQGNVYVGGQFTNVATFGSQTLTWPGHNAYLAKYDRAGTAQWAQVLAGTGQSTVADVAVDRAGNVYAVGTFSGTATFGTRTFTSSRPDSARPDGFVVKLDSQGTLQWATHLEGSLMAVLVNVEPTSVTVDSAGGVCIGGTFSSQLTAGSVTLNGPTSPVPTAFVLKLDANGAGAWGVKVTGCTFSVCRDVQFDGYGYFYATGIFSGLGSLGGAPLFSANNNQFDPFLCLIRSSTGRISWVRQAGGNQGFVGINSVSVDSIGDAYVTGLFNTMVVFDGIRHTSALVGGAETFVAKFGYQRGRAQWVKTGSATNMSRGRAIGTDSQGNSYVVGEYSGSLTFDSTTVLTSNDSLNVYVVSYDGQGNYRWLQQAGGSREIYGLGLALDQQFGGLYLTGAATGATTIGGQTLPGHGAGADMYLALMQVGTPLGLAGPRAVAGFTFFPNPAHQQVRLKGLPTATAVEVLDALGRVVLTQPLAAGQTDATLTVGGLPPGLYTVRAGTAARRLVVE